MVELRLDEKYTYIIIDGVRHGIYPREEYNTIESVLKMLYARNAISDLTIAAS